MEERKVKYNWPQYFYLLVQASFNLMLWARATGKTTGPFSCFIYNNMWAMPLSHGIWAGPSFEKMFTQMIPNLRRGFDLLGLKEGIHYQVGKFFDEKYKVPKPYVYPDKPKYFVHACSGSGFSLVSYDRPSTRGNGLDAHWLAIDEGKMCDREAVKESMGALRGCKEEFGHLSNHKSVMICSDKPTNSKGNWLYDYMEQMDKDLIETIAQTAICIEELMQEQERSKSKKHIQNLESIIKRFKEDLNVMRKQATFVSEASTIDNICNLGIDVIENFYKILSDIEFQVTVLNKTLYASENEFYSCLDEDIHGYTATNYSYMEGHLDIAKDNVKDCRWDDDLKRNEPLDIAFDHNNAINWVMVGQFGNKKTYRLLKSMFVLKKEGYIDELIDHFCKYYEHHPCKKVNYFYNHTSKVSNAQGDRSPRDRVYARFEKNKWEVIDHYYGREPSHLVKFELANDMLAGKDDKLPLFRYNINNNEVWYQAMKSTQSRQGSTGFEKDKTSERDPNVSPQFATHASEAWDALIVGRFRSAVKKTQEFIDITVGK